MNRFLGILLLLVIGVVGLGYYLGWFQVSTGRTDQKPNVTITIDEDKIRKDKDKALDKLHEAGQSVKEKIETETKKVKESTKP